MIQNTTNDLVSIIGELPHLHEIGLSSQLLSSVLVSSLAKHPRLTVLSQNSSDVEDPHWPDIHYHRRLSEGDFDSLRLLQLDGNMDDMIHWFHNKDMLPSLRTFRAELRDYPEAAKIRECFVLLVEAFRNVTDLTFDLDKHNLSRPTSVPEFSITIFEPLFEYEALTCFVFDLPDALSLCDRDMAMMARAWPQLTSLSLGKSACSTESLPLLTLGALVIFAQLCPHLHSLSLVIDATANPSRVPVGSVFSDEFKTLYLGLPHIDSAEAVGTFLSRILPAHTELELCEGLSANPALRVFRRDNWRETKLWFTVLTRVHEEGKKNKVIPEATMAELDELRVEVVRLREENHNLQIANGCACMICSRTRQPCHPSVFPALRLEDAET